jgi:hypothetical protein
MERTIIAYVEAGSFTEHHLASGDTVYLEIPDQHRKRIRLLVAVETKHGLPLLSIRPWVISDDWPPEPPQAP